MTYKSLLKRDLSPDPPGSWKPGSNATVHGPRFTVHVLRFDETGFTLIEIIAALIIISVIAAMIVPATGIGLQQTARGVGECREIFELQGEMERIVSIYKEALEASGGDIDLAAFWETVQNEDEIDHIDPNGTGYIEEDEDSFSIDNPSTPTNLFLVTLSQDDYRIASIFSK